MTEVVAYLHKRRMIMMGAVVLLAVIAVIVSYNFQMVPATYFGGKYNLLFIYALIVYKLIELPILYYLLVHRNLKKLKKNSSYEESLLKFKKHAKLLLFLIPQGNTVFGVIAYKLSGSILYFLFFSCIALITLYLIKPNKFKLY
ncbi:MAG TPA: hypothetical protein PLM93_09285 [Sulfuricurvum sp.]|nr:MAG: hypothetical protein B7Y30_07400 [Campylobacterales bacterium 16-40-21]OZA02468.1 MAG: hypothetical protein B7X89_08995 [Sulfuricurvum sp. 17-40-25]HQS67360.1 hypothetical protein [Sulfuricurvum sp.]HQT36111.1 hypothetical protein [Sulfuricurvum sp.]